MNTTPAPLHRGPFAALGFAAYLGTSWTWVIGMLFPALILRDYGLWGFVAFAVPNVLGAAAMGFVLTPERARRILEKHKTACEVFSTTTLFFHISVIAFFFPRWFGPSAWLIVALSAVACLVAQRLWGTRGVWLTSALVWGLSIAMFVKGMNTEGAWAGASWDMGRLGGKGLFAFIPASGLGFALCPYLDLTFLKARAETEKNTGRWAFALGFGVVFCAMIFFTVCYGGQLLPFFEVLPEHAVEPVLPPVWLTILMAHLPVQVGLTLAWHGTELVRSETSRQNEKKRQSLLMRFLSVSFLFIIGWIHSDHNGTSHFGMLDTEGIYRSILLLYGTALPAYVLLKMIPTHTPERVKTCAFVSASLIAYPLAWGAFVLNHHWLIIPCAGVLTLAFTAVQCWPQRALSASSGDDRVS